MSQIIEMPKLSDTMEEGAIASWLKKEGEFVDEGEAIVEIETDKATMEYNSPYKGVLLKILVQPGETCDLNAPIAVLGGKGEKFDPSMVAKSEGPAPKKHETPAPAAKPEKTAAATPAPAPTKSEPKVVDGRIKSSPLARKIASDRGVELSQIQGSGPQGRIVLRDVENLAKGPGGKPSAPAAKAPTAPARIGEDRVEEIPLSMMRKTIAKRLLAGKNEAPHFYLTVSTNMDNSLEWRKKLNAGQENSKISVNDIIVLAAAKALVKHPEINSSWGETVIRRHYSVHMSLAVALEQGLVTPVIRNCDTLGVREIAAQSKAYITKAKNGELQPEEYAGGTFTISNLGMMGIEEFTAIINPPQAAILAVGATKPTPVVNAAGTVEVKQVMKMTMSCDHRVIDGAMGAKFLQTLVSYLEEPLMMLT
ncbi:MAG: pyruvate dehydrogenase complex dihydrolipoamide acetyltransferase [Oligoflexales bacterium]